MLEVLRRSQRLSVALPASFTRDIPHLREKTSRVGIVARALAIFRIDEAIIYTDRSDITPDKEGQLFQKLLAFQETPQYLRRTIFAHDPDLQFAGILPPLRLPNHPGNESPRNGLIREGIVTRSGSPSLVNAGFENYVRINSQLQEKERVTIRLIRTGPELEGEVLEPNRLPIYWGFKVTRKGSTLGRLIKDEHQDLTISTSRRGKPVREVLPDVTRRWISSKRTLILFGSPDQGVPEILRREGVEVEKVADFNINMVQNQGVETIRTEEALIASLSVMNLWGEN